MGNGSSMIRLLLNLCAALTLALAPVSVAFGADAPLGFAMPAIFSDNMVLQRDMSVPIWGTAPPGEQVSVRFGTQEKSATADSDGRWTVHLDAMRASAEPSTLTVDSSSGETTFENVLVGEVWLGSGQSNMQTTSVALQTTDKIQDAENPEIRFFTAPRSGSGAWVPCTTDNARAFSATAYYFAIDLWEHLQIPVGMVVACEGSSSIETWMPPESVRADESLVDANDEKLVDEMERFDRFHAAYPDIPEEEKRAVLMDHCLSNYAFARSFLNPDGTMKDGVEDGVLWHMTLIKPAFCFTKFIEPISPFAIRGVIWYQGETNALANGDPQYARKQQLLVEGWRKSWNSDFPFYFVQIPPCESYPLLAPFWLQQYIAASITPKSALIPTVDIGDLKSSHPENKWDIGSRLVMLVMHDTYGKSEIVASGPTFRSFTAKGPVVEVEFDHIGSGLTTSDGEPPDWFEIAGSEMNFQRAKAKIVDDKIVLESSVKSPEYIRFAWSYLAEPNLRNQEGLPAFPFTTEEEFFLGSQSDP